MFELSFRLEIKLSPASTIIYVNNEEGLKVSFRTPLEIDFVHRRVLYGSYTSLPITEMSVASVLDGILMSNLLQFDASDLP